MTRFRTSISNSALTPLAALRPGFPSLPNFQPLASKQDSDLLPVAEPTAKRPRISDLSGYLHCSVIGTCLSTAELRQILVKLNIEGVENASDHELHAKGVTLAGKRSPAAKLLSKALDRRHRLAVNQFAKATSIAELRRLWDEALQRGDIPGAYWAVITHPKANDELIRHVFGEVHMLSHLVGAANRADIRRLNLLEAENARLLAKTERQQAQLRDAIVARDEKIGTLNQLLSKAIAGGQTVDAMTSADAERETLAKLVEDLERRLSAESRKRTRADERIATLEAKLRAEQDLRKAAEAQAQSLRDELTALETALAESAPAGEAEPDSPVDLRGLSLLYVGGRADHVARLRASAELCGATLAHHDGGVEESTGLLDGLIQRADTVLFPVDCVSHQAVWAVKRLCRQAEKPYMPLRSAGLGSFLAALRHPAIIGLQRAVPH